MRKNTRDTIRRPKEWELEPVWDSTEREVSKKSGKKPLTRTVEEDDLDETEFEDEV